MLKNRKIKSCPLISKWLAVHFFFFKETLNHIYFAGRFQTTPQCCVLDTSFGPPSTSALDIIAHRTMAGRHIWGGNVTLENLFIEQLMSNKQLLKRGRLIAWRQAEQGLPLGGRKFAGAEERRKSCGLSRRVERRFPRRAAAKGGGRCKQEAPRAFGEAPVTLSIVSPDKQWKRTPAKSPRRGGIIRSVRACARAHTYSESATAFVRPVWGFFSFFVIVSCILVCVTLYCVHGGFYAYLRMCCSQKKKRRKEKSKESLWHEKSIK